jgi:hypothetical protein
MAEKEVSQSTTLLTFLGSLGAILIFALIIFIAYLPNRPDAVDAQTTANRQAKADEARAQGLAKLNGYELINAETGSARIPVEVAMEMTVSAYQAPAATED